tara:strand:+ start:1637 stop:2539 length:903 start_codon:yes stop_codon:yes gene_type:complete
MIFKKPKFWDYKKLSFFSYILFPFTLFIRLNNFLLDRFFVSKSNQIKTICVGNIYVGGTGKTPTTIKIYALLKDLNYKVVTAKKLYRTHQDEQKILEKQTRFVTAKSRKKILDHSINNNEEVIIFDDGLQDRSLNYNLKFVCFDADCWIGNGQLIPSGPLREKIDSLKKFDALFIKNDNNSNLNNIFKIIKSINPQLEIFCSNFIVENSNNFDKSKNYISFSGIGNPLSFKKILLKENFKIVEEISFPDHYEYNDNIIKNIISKAKKLNTKLITTEKDFVKISDIFKKDIDFLKVRINFE